MVSVINYFNTHLEDFCLSREMKNYISTKIHWVQKKDTYRQYGLKHFNIQAAIATDTEVKKMKYPLGFASKLWQIFSLKILRIHNIGWSEHILTSKKYYFDGYWQTYKYADEIRKHLIQDLKLKEPLDQNTLDVMSNIGNTNSISLHIRRGDYVTDAKTSKIHDVCDLEYYRKAVDIVSKKIKNPQFFIFSDDIEWAKKNLKIQYPMVFVSDLKIEDYEEMILMSKCKHNIIANSSFSWWGAWLNTYDDKVVVAPQKWSNRHKKDYKNLIPNTWIKI